mgnify:CR=1 FL=1
MPKRLWWILLLFVIISWHWLLWLWWHPAENKTVKVEEKVPVDAVSKVSFPSLQIITAKGSVEWDFTIKNIEILSNKAILSEIYGVYYQGIKKPYLWLTGAKAELSNSTRNINFSGKIILKTAQGEQIEADSMVWVAEEEKVHAKGNIKLLKGNIVTITDELVADLKNQKITTGYAQTQILEEE